MGDPAVITGTPATRGARLYRGAQLTGWAGKGGTYVVPVLAGLRNHGHSQSKNARLSDGPVTRARAMTPGTTTARILPPIIESLPERE